MENLKKRGALTIVDIESATHVTHSGAFHCDEVLATIFFLLAGENMRLARVSAIPDNIDPHVVMYDIGGGRYDHHQKGGNGKRKVRHCVPYASAGLVWRDTYKKILAAFSCPLSLVQEAYYELDRRLVEGVDGVDNGVKATVGGEFNYSIISLSSIVSSFNLAWDESGNSDNAFVDAVNIVLPIVVRLITSAISAVKSISVVDAAIDESKDNIVVLPAPGMPWQRRIFSKKSEKAQNALFVVYPTSRGGYGVQAIPPCLGSFGQKCPFPQEWRGASIEVLKQLTGLKDVQFCHSTGFFAAAESIDSAIKLAKLAQK